MPPPCPFCWVHRSEWIDAMIPRVTRRLAAAAIALIFVWLWAWIWLDWELHIAPLVTPAVSTIVPQARVVSMEHREIDSLALLRSPAFYPDRRPHGFRPDMKEETPAQAPRMDFELTTTVVGRTQSFAILRLPGSAQSVIARVGEPFEADPSWQVTKIDKMSVSFTGNQGQLLTLNLKPPMPAQPPPSVPTNMVAPIASPNATSPQAPLAAPVAATQPSQGNPELRARIEARRRDAESRARLVRTQ